MKLLYAEDEETMAEAVVDILTYHNYLVDTVADGAEALAYAQNGDYDGIILDVMMPKMDGLEVLSRLREMGCRTPILLLTAKGAVEDRVAGLDLGADDYLPKPFVMEEFLARVRAMLRRREAFTPEILQYDDVTLHGGTLEDLLVKVWGYNTEAELGTVWVYLSYLRKRLAKLGSRVKIKGRRGIGYTLEVGQ